MNGLVEFTLKEACLSECRVAVCRINYYDSVVAWWQIFAFLIFFVETTSEVEFFFAVENFRVLFL
jgi:hypothetical protein